MSPDPLDCVSEPNMEISKLHELIAQKQQGIAGHIESLAGNMAGDIQELWGKRPQLTTKMLSGMLFNQ